MADQTPYNLRQNPKTSQKVREDIESTQTVVPNPEASLREDRNLHERTEVEEGSLLTIKDDKSDENSENVTLDGKEDTLSTSTQNSLDGSRETTNRPIHQMDHMNTHQDQRNILPNYNDIMKRMDQLMEIMIEQRTEVKAQIEEVNKEIKIEIQVQNEKIEQKLETVEHHYCELKKILYKNIDELETRMTSKICLLEQNQEKQQEKVKKEMEKIEKKMEEKINEEMVDRHNDITANVKQIIVEECSSQVKELRTEVKYHKNNVEDIKEELEKQETKIKMLEERHIQMNPTPSQIQVICTGGSTLNELQLPRFNGKSQNPKECLKRIKHVYGKAKEHNKNTCRDKTEILIDIIDNIMDGSAAKWWMLNKEGITTWKEFEQEFENKYWNREIQRNVRQRLEMERYRSGGRLNRSEYFIEKVLTMKSLTTVPSEEEIVDQLVEHFSEPIQDARRVQNINTIKEFELLLQREDMKEYRTDLRNNQMNYNQPQTTRKNHEQFESTTIGRRDYQSKPHTSDNMNQRAYQPRRGFNNQATRGQSSSYQQKEYHNNQKRFETQGKYQQHQNNSDDHRFTHRKFESTEPRYNYHGKPETTYPTKEQRQVCHMVTAKEERESSSDYQTRPHLEGNNIMPSTSLNCQALTENY